MSFFNQHTIPIILVYGIILYEYCAFVFIFLPIYYQNVKLNLLNVVLLFWLIRLSLSHKALAETPESPLPPGGGGLGWGGACHEISLLQLHPPPTPSRQGRGSLVPEIFQKTLTLLNPHVLTSHFWVRCSLQSIR